MIRHYHRRIKPGATVRNRDTNERAVVHHANKLPGIESAYWVKILGSGKWASWYEADCVLVLSKKWLRRKLAKGKR